MPEEDWNDKAKGLLKSYIKRKNVKYHDLARALNGVGLEENHNSIATKINRGTFSFTFFLQCMHVLGINKINLEEL